MSRTPVREALIKLAQQGMVRFDRGVRVLQTSLHDLDEVFALRLLEASGNLRLAEYVDGLRDMVLRRGVSTAGSSRSLDEIVAEHRTVLDRIDAGALRSCSSRRRRASRPSTSTWDGPEHATHRHMRSV